jgi:NDP-hexose 4-ketoreductase
VETVIPNGTADRYPGMVRCLVLGASGFLGRHVYAALSAHPHLDVLTAGRRAAHADLWLDLATTAPAEVAEVLRVAAPAVVVNCAGTTEGEPTALVAGNVVTVAALLDAVGRLPCPPRLVHLGCAAEYGAVPIGAPVAESAPARPVDTYGMTKLAGTELLLAARRQGVPAVVLRVFEPFGPGTPARSLAGRLAAALRTGEPARLGLLDGYRDFVDVRDVAAAVLAATTARELPPPLLNVGSGRAVAVRALAGVMSVRAGGAVVLEAEGSGPATWQHADLTAVTAVLGWRPAVQLTDSVRDMWQVVPV